MTDPWSLHSELSCPSCHVKGSVVSDLGTRYEYEDTRMVCCECGQSWDDAGVYADCALKEARIHYARLVEGRPYEPPPPVQREPGKGISMDAYDSILRDYYRADDRMWAKVSRDYHLYGEKIASYAMQVKLGEPVRAKPTAWNDVTIESDAPNPWPSIIGSMPDLPEPEDE